MSGKGFVIPPIASLEYIYDGSWAGFLCCVFESVYTREQPLEIYTEDSSLPSLYRQKYIETCSSKAARVLASISIKISKRALELLQHCFLSCLQQKECLMLRFLLRGYQEGASYPYQLCDADVAPLLKAEQHLLNEAHLLKGFVRFDEVNGFLVSVISPKNFVLPFLMPHFSARMCEESFLIFDETHATALVYENGKGRLASMEGISFNHAEGDQYQDLWKLFYNSIAIEERKNERCRRSHMPKRYWEHMPEVCDLISFGNRKQ